MNSTQSIIAEMLQIKQKRRKVARRIAASSLAVVLIVSFLAIIPAITMTDKADVSLTGINNTGNSPSLLALTDLIEPSGKVEDSLLNHGWEWNYASDAATSQIESQPFGTTAEDGKVLVDKSVVYGKDDYGAFEEDSYTTGLFGVTLSALAQEYNVYNTIEVHVPVDVVFILDTSGSMVNNNAGNVSRAEAMVNAVNPAIKQIMDANSENRVGVVNFSQGSADLLQLSRYTTTASGSRYLRWYNNEIQTVSGGIRNSSGTTVTASTGSQSGITNWAGTYTQSGIARGNAMLQRNTDLTYTDENGNTVARKPIFILLSDGDPTYCTSNYTNVLNGPHYGNGVYTTVSNNKGVQGFYTILSANHYKQMVSDHYNTDTGFYTIGLGINETGYQDLSQQSATGDHYKRTVLNPTQGNISSVNNSAAKNNGSTGQQLQQLLYNTYTGSTVTVDSQRSGAIGATSANVPVIKNPYSQSGYANGAYFGNFTQDELTEIFKDIITEAQEVVEYGFVLRENTALDMSDPIGTGMELKSIPVLRYNGKNYAVTSQSTEIIGTDTVTTYVYKYTVTDDGIDRTVELGDIVVTVTTDALGNQTVNMKIPDSCMPVYSPGDTKGEYIPQLPARLIYQVGLKDSVQVKTGDVFYTNRWEGAEAIATLYPAENNPYFMPDGGYTDHTVEKSENTTGTSGHVSSSEKNTVGNHNVVVLLGNNGKITVGAQKSAIAITVNKQWRDEYGNILTDISGMPDVTVSLYRETDIEGSAAEYVSQVVLNNNNNWQHTFTDLPYQDENENSYTYYVKEDPVDGYISTVNGTVTNDDGTITVTNKTISDSGTIVVKKKWQNYFGDPIQDTSKLPEINVELWRHVNYTEPEGVTLTIVYGGNTQQVEVQSGTSVTFAIRATYSSSNRARNATIRKDGANITSTRSSAVRTTGSQVITVNNDTTVTYTSSGYNASSWDLLNLNYTEPGPGGTHTSPDEFYQSATLNQSVNWQKVWENLPVTEEKDNRTYTYTYFVKEISSIPGYTTSYSPENDTGIQGGELDIINKANTAMDVLPATGGIGTIPFIIGGILIVLCAACGLLYKRRHQERSETPSTG